VYSIRSHIAVLCWLFLLLLFSSCNRNDSFSIHGNLRCVDGDATIAYLLKMDKQGEMIVIDSTEVQSGEFQFKGRVEYPAMYYVQVGRRHPIDIFVENSNILIKGSVLLPDEIKITGSRSFDELRSLQNEFKKIQNKQNATLIELENARKHNNEELEKRLENSYRHYPDTLLLMTKKFVENNPTSVGAAYFVCTLTQTLEISKLKDIIKLFDSSIKNSEYVQFLNEELMLTQKLSLDSPAPKFKLPTSTGDTVKLSDYEGRYLLIHFWASWSENCEEQNDDLKKLYNKYHEEGLEILSISLDKKKDEWLCGIERDSMQWQQASDLLYWESPVSKYYRVQSIPYDVLIGPNGKVISINPKKYVLDAKIQEIFGF